VFRRLTTPQLVVDVSIGVVFFLIAAPIEVATTGVTGLPARFGPGLEAGLAVVIALLFSAALAIRRLSPALALGAAWTGAIVQMALGRPPSFADLAIFGVLYVTAAYGTRVVYWSGLASAILGAVVITVYLLVGPVFAAGGLSWQTLPIALVMLVAAAFALGLSWTTGALVRTAVRARENQRAQRRAEAEAVAEQERVRIARDMHDVVAHSLAVIVAQADGARYALAAGVTDASASGAAASDPSVAAEALGTISSTARAALSDVRLLLTQLRHSQGDGPQPTLADLEQLYTQVRAAGVALAVDVDPAPPGVPPAAVQLAVYRILQEALTNALRHGGEGGVRVRLAWHPDRVGLEVRNAVGSPQAPGGSGHGLVGMAERAKLIGGRLDAGVSGAEFVVSATLPIGGAPR
jgi:signal transduction histidine kinase